MRSSRLSSCSSRRRMLLLIISLPMTGSTWSFAEPVGLNPPMQRAQPSTKTASSKLVSPGVTNSSATLKNLTVTDDVSVSILDLPGVAHVPVPVTTPAQTGESELLQQRFPNGKLQVERYVTEDRDGNIVNNGMYREFDGEGNVIRTGKYTMGKMDGEWTQDISLDAVKAIAPNLDPAFKPPFRSVATFVDGILHGNWLVSDGKGNPVLVWQFAGGQRENVSTWFDSRNNATLTVAYSEGVPHGPAIQMIAGQREPKKLEYHHGHVIQEKVDWYEKGKKRVEASLLVPTAGRLVEHDWWNTKIRSEPMESSSTVRHGRYTEWYPNGQKKLEGNFERGEQVGEYQWWYANGQLRTQGSYLDGMQTGRWLWWHENGMKMLEGDYDHGVQAGQWSKWNAQGGLEIRDLAANFPKVEVMAIETQPVSAEVEAPARRPAVATAPPVRSQGQPAVYRRPLTQPASVRRR